MDSEPLVTASPPPTLSPLARLALGGLALGGQIVRTAPVPPGTVAPLPPAAPSARHALLGALLTAAAHARRDGARLSAMTAAAARWARRSSRARRLLERAQRRVDAWTELGRREETEARALALSLGEDLVRVALAVIAESPEVRAVVHEQSAGLTESALASLRDRSAQADDRAAALGQRVLGRRARPPGAR
jgi:hypothetical protein